jgi:hypothetical protein
MSENEGVEIQIENHQKATISQKRKRPRATRAIILDLWSEIQPAKIVLVHLHLQQGHQDKRPPSLNPMYIQ